MRFTPYRLGMRKLRHQLLSSRLNFLRLIVLCAVGLAARLIAAAPQGGWGSNVLSLGRLKDNLNETGRLVGAFRVEGFIEAVAPSRGILALRDNSAALLLELPLVDASASAGKHLVINAGRCVLTRTRFGARLSALPVVDNDGLHSALARSGSVWLDAGWQPIRVEWFNGAREFSLSLEYEGPRCPRQKAPCSILGHRPEDNTRVDFQPGVCYKAYEQDDWRVLPDFSLLHPIKEGIATNFTPAYRTRDENCGLTFDGSMEISHPGLYTFYLTSRDGSRLYAGYPPLSYELSSNGKAAVPAAESIEDALADRERDAWVTIEGEVAYVSQYERGLEMEVVAGGNHVPVTVLEGMKLFSSNLLHQRVRLAGICEFSRNGQDKRLIGVFVPGSEQVEILGAGDRSEGRTETNVLTLAAQVRSWKSAETTKNMAARVRGVVIYATAIALVLEDSSGGVYAGLRAGRWARQPGLGELWEVEGTTNPGLFSPCITVDKATFLGCAPLPEPIQPKWDQLMNGNLDAEYAELRGVITFISTDEITLLTPDGRCSVVRATDRPLPQLPKTLPGGGSLIDSVVRIRGCFATSVDLRTRQVAPGKICIYPALVEVEEPAPPDPFLLPKRQPEDLMWFNARASALLRTKLAGQVLYGFSGKYFVWDGQTGFRVFTKSAPLLETGDLIEAVGFPKLGGPSLVLQEARIRKSGHAALPGSVAVPPERWLDPSLDSTLVEVKATLLSDTYHQGDRVLELQNGPRHFTARLRTGARTSALLPAGCRLKLTGVYASADEDPASVGATAAPFELWLNSNANIAVLQRPSWWTLRRAAMAVAALGGLLCVACTWVALLRREVEARTAQLKEQIEERQLMEQRNAIERERARVAHDLHDELGAGLTEVSMLGALANMPAVSAEARSRYLEQITPRARSLVSSLDEIVWAVDPNYDSVGSLASYFSLFAESFLNLAGITCRFGVAEPMPECPLDSKERHVLFCAFKEALNNVIRHSKATEARIDFEVAGGQLVLSIIDNGRGFECGAGVPGRDGLRGITERMRQVGGGSQIASAPGGGTRVELHLPLRRTHHDQSRHR